MSRSRREAELEAMYGDRYPAVLVSQMGTRKRDRKSLLGERMFKSFEHGTLDSYEGGTMEAGAPITGTAADPLMDPNDPLYARHMEGIRRREENARLQNVVPSAAAPNPAAGTPGAPAPPAPGAGTPPVPGPVVTPTAPAAPAPGMLPEAQQGKPWWWLRMRNKVEGANPYSKNQAILANAQKQMTAGTHTFKAMPTGRNVRQPVTPPAPTPVIPGPGPAPLPTNPINPPPLPGPPQPTPPPLARGTLPSYAKGSFDISDLIEAGLGGSYDQMKEAGSRNYPALPGGSQHHAEAAKRAAQMYGFVPSQLLGLGVEGAEALLTGRNTDLGDTARDLGANLVGGLEGTARRYLSPQLTDALLGRRR